MKHLLGNGTPPVPGWGEGACRGAGWGLPAGGGAAPRAAGPAGRALAAARGPAAARAPAVGGVVRTWFTRGRTPRLAVGLPRTIRREKVASAVPSAGALAEVDAGFLLGPLFAGDA